MNHHEIAGRWKQLRGKVKERWGLLTDDDLDRIDGARDQLVGRIQEVYGKTEAQAEREAEEFFERLTA
jgi:uncharacterized protein YjbJ (UPF0337 family)